MSERLRRARHRRGGDAGFSIILVALLLTVFMIVTAIVVDLGNARQQKREAQAAADAGALAGAQDLYASPHVPSGCTDANCSAAYYTFQSAHIVPSSAAALLASRSNSCTLPNEALKSGETCWQYSLNGTTVDVKNPYALNNAAADSSMIHVKVCWDAPTTFARVIGRDNVTVCAIATAQNTGSGGGSGGVPPPVADCDPEDNFADANDNPTVYVFNPGDYPDIGGTVNFSKGNAIPKANTDLVALFDGHGTDINLSSIVFKAPTTVSGPNGQSVTLPRITSFGNHGPEDSNAHGIGYVVESLDASGKVRPYTTGGTYKVLIAYQLPDDSHLKVGGKSFVYSASLNVNDSDNVFVNGHPTHCGEASWTFTHDGKNLTSGGTTCGENSFFAFTPEPSNGQAIAGTTTVKGFYTDESDLQMHDFSDSAFWSTQVGNFGIDFTFTNVGTGATTRIPPAPATISTVNDANGNPAVGYSISGLNADTAHIGKEAFNRTISWPVPKGMANGNYTINLKAYDTDNNKAGNDCGVYTWNITVTGGTTGSVNLIE